MDRQPLGRLELGTLSANIVIDPEGRKCIEVPIGEGVYGFTVSQALLFRELLDLGVRAIAQYTPQEPAAEEP